jgi:hypothetical protein
MTETENNAHMYRHLMIAAFLFVVFIAGVEHILPYDTPAVPMAAVAGNLTTPLGAPTTPAAQADCLPSGSGGRCIPFDEVVRTMQQLDEQSQEEVAPANPAAANEEKI